MFHIFFENSWRSRTDTFPRLRSMFICPREVTWVTNSRTSTFLFGQDPRGSILTAVNLSRLLLAGLNCCKILQWHIVTLYLGFQDTKKHQTNERSFFNHFLCHFCPSIIRHHKTRSPPTRMCAAVYVTPLLIFALARRCFWGKGTWDHRLVCCALCFDKDRKHS